MLLRSGGGYEQVGPGWGMGVSGRPLRAALLAGIATVFVTLIVLMHSPSSYSSSLSISLPAHQALAEDAAVVSKGNIMVRDTMLITIHGEPSGKKHCVGTLESGPCHGNNVLMYRSNRIAHETNGTKCKAEKWSYVGRLLDKKRVKKDKLQNFRGVAFDSKSSALYLAVAHSSRSNILRTVLCRNKDGTFASRGYQIAQHRLLDHPYAVAFDRTNRVYASNQNLDDVVRFNPTDAAASGRAQTIAKVSNPRGIAITSSGTMFVASTKNPGGLYYYRNIDDVPDGEIAQPSGRVSFIPHPVGVAFDEASQLLFVGSYNKKNPKDSCVFALDASSLPPKKIACLRPDPPLHFSHPAGLVVAATSRRLHVVAQDAANVYTFALPLNDSDSDNCSPFQFLGVSAENLPEKPEQIGVVMSSSISLACDAI